MFGKLHFWFVVLIKTASHSSNDRTSQWMSYFCVIFMRWIRAMLCAIPTIKNYIGSQYNFWRYLSLSIFSIPSVSKTCHSSIIISLPRVLFLLLSQLLLILCLNNDDILLVQWISDINLRRHVSMWQSLTTTRENEKIRTIQ